MSTSFISIYFIEDRINFTNYTRTKILVSYMFLSFIIRHNEFLIVVFLNFFFNWL